MKKITDDQLKKITDQQQKLSRLLNNIGVIEIQKHNIASEVKILSNDIEQTKKELEEEYGSVNINLETGEIIIPEAVPNPITEEELNIDWGEKVSHKYMWEKKK